MSAPDRELVRLARRASPEAVALARAILERDIADSAWAVAVGPCLRQADAAALLGRQPKSIRQDPRLLAIRDRAGRTCYPVFQFDGPSLLPGIADVVTLLRGTVAP